MVEYLGKDDLKLRDVIDGKKGFWVMCTNQGKAYWLDYDKVIDKFNELIETVNLFEEKGSNQA